MTVMAIGGACQNLSQISLGEHGDPVGQVHRIVPGQVTARHKSLRGPRSALPPGRENLSGRFGPYWEMARRQRRSRSRSVSLDSPYIE
jgi:hypothetical protein